MADDREKPIGSATFDVDALSGFVYECAERHVDPATATRISNDVLANFDRWIADRAKAAEIMRAASSAIPPIEHHLADRDTKTTESYINLKRD